MSEPVPSAPGGARSTPSPSASVSSFSSCAVFCSATAAFGAAAVGLGSSGVKGGVYEVVDACGTFRLGGHAVKAPPA
ncbi:hypothetical protein OH77DRAFT_147360 [Trametes cingulata]|nr:hypothetical protein OH77DRAFT_147360 [Trametes cingulata]